jgi:ADP-heptose:LPS heptosyltransferase
MKDPQKILVVALDNLGDVVMATALLEPRQRAVPAAAIGMWVKKYAAGVLGGHPHLDVVHAADPFWDTAPGHGRGDVGPFFKTLREIKSARYDLAFLLNTEWRRSVACWWAKIPSRVGFDYRQSGFWLSQARKNADAGPHCVDDHRKLFRFWEETSGKNSGIADRIFTPHLYLADDEKKSGKAWREKNGWNGTKIVVMHPFSGDPVRNWPFSHWIKLLEQMAGETAPLRFVVIGGPGDEVPLVELARLPEKCFRTGRKIRRGVKK